MPILQNYFPAAKKSPQAGKKLVALTLLCGIAAFLPLATKAAQEDSFKILTLNTWLDRFKNNPSVLGAFLTAGNFDILTFQELRQNSTYVSVLPKILSDAGLGTYATRQAGDTGVFSRLPGSFGAHGAGVTVPFTTVDATRSRPQTTVGTVHLNYYDPSVTRARQAKALNQWAGSQAQPIILTGDFNAGDLSERGLHSVRQQELLLRAYVKKPTNEFYLGLLRNYAKDQPALDAFIAQWRGRPSAAIDAAPIPAGLFQDETYPVQGNLPQTLNILKQQFQLIQAPSERETFKPHSLDDGSATWPSAAEDATNTWPSWDRAKIDHFLASRPFAKWWTIADAKDDAYSGVMSSVGFVTNPDGSQTALSDHEAVAHTLRWVGPILETLPASDGSAPQTRIVWGKDASTFGERGGVFQLSRNNMRNDVYLGQIADENGLPALPGLSDAEKKTLLDCASASPRLQEAIARYCIDDHSFIGQTLVKDGGTVAITEDAALGGPHADLVLDGGGLRIDGNGVPRLNREIVLGPAGGRLDITSAAMRVTADEIVSGAGGLEKAGPGILVLNARNTYAGATVIGAGTLIVGDAEHPDASIPGAVTVNTGATLGGGGTIGGLIVADGGAVSPGNSIGALTVNGNVIFAPNAIYRVEIAPTGASDRIVATGTAILGGSVDLFKAPGPYLPGTRYTIISAAGGISGSFAALRQDMPFIDIALSYGSNTVALVTSRTATPFPAVGVTANQIATATALEALGQGNALHDAVLQQRSIADARQAFDALSGEAHASLKSILIENSRLVRDAVITRTIDGLRGARTAINATGFSLWGRIWGQRGYTGSDGNAAKTNRTTGGFIIGADTAIAENWRIGFAGGYGATRATIADRSSSADSDDYHLALYGGGKLGAVELRFGGAYSWHDIDVNRAIAFPGMSSTAKSLYGARTAQLFGEIGYEAKLGKATFEPFANLAYVNLATDRVKESALTAAGDNTGVTYATLGIRLAKRFELDTAPPLTARATLGWQRAFGDTTPVSSMRFDGGQPFPIAGLPVARDAFLIEGRLDFEFDPAITAGLSYTGQIAAKAQDHGFKGNVTVAF